MSVRNINLLIPGLVEYVEQMQERETSTASIKTRAQHGDTAAARMVMQQFREAWLGGRVVTSTADDTALLVTVYRLLGRMLDQPEEAFRSGLGYQSIKRTDQMRHERRLLYFAMEHAMYGMGEVLPQADASKLMMKVVERLPTVFRELRSMNEESLARTYREVRDVDDPMGYGCCAPGEND